MPRVLWNCLLVGLGGMVGSITRYSCSLLFQSKSLTLPYGTLTANWLGCLVIGALAELTALGGWLPPEARLTLAVGFCGGLTTLSSLIYELGQFIREGDYYHAGGYLAVTLLGSMVCFYLGMFLVKILIRSTGGLWN
jgi:fluoride exporter